MPGLQITRILLDAPGAKTDLSLSLDGRGGSWVAALEYSADRFSRTAAEQALDDFLRFFRSAVAAPAAPIAPVRALPLTPAQMRVWLDQQRSPEVPLYNVAIAIDIDGVVDAGAFARAFERLVESTDALRLEMSTMAGVPRQRVRDSIRGVTERVDLIGLSDGERRGVAQTGSDPPVRSGRPAVPLRPRAADAGVVHLAVRPASPDHRRIVGPHLVRSAVAPVRRGAGRAGRQRRTVALVRRLRGDAAGARWRGRCVVERAVRRRRAAALLRRASAEDVHGGDADAHGRFTPTSITRFRAAAAAPGVPATQAAFLLCGAALVALLHRMTGETTIALGVPFHQRAERRHRGVVGPVDGRRAGCGRVQRRRYPRRSRVAPRSALRAALRHSGSPPPRRVRERACDVLLNVQTTRLEVFCGHRATIDWVHSGHERESLTVQLHDLGARRHGLRHRHARRCVRRAGSGRNGGALVRVLDQCVDDRRTRIRDLRIGDDREPPRRRRVGRPAACRRVQAQSAIARIVAAARARPDAIAIESGGARTTYAALADQVRRVASGLARRGSGAATIVGVCLERGAEFVEAILGTWPPAPPTCRSIPCTAPRIDACAASAGARVVIVADVSAPCGASRGVGCAPGARRADDRADAGIRRSRVRDLHVRVDRRAERRRDPHRRARQLRRLRRGRVRADAGRSRAAIRVADVRHGGRGNLPDARRRRHARDARRPDARVATEFVARLAASASRVESSDVVLASARRSVEAMPPTHQADAGRR